MRSLLHAPRTRKRSIAAATLGALALVGSLLVATPAQAINDTGTGGVFVPASGRVLDTKVGTGGFRTPMEGNKYRTIKIAGLAGIPDDGTVGAVSLNATVTGSADNGTLFGRPDADTSRTTMLIYNANAGEYVSNTAIVAVSDAGTIQVSTETAARLILDVQGYYTANTDGTAAGGFVSVAGKRIVDTRSGLGAPKALLAPGKSVDIQVAGTNGVPADASGAVVNLLPINTTDSDGYLTPYATGATRPDNALHYAPSVNTSIQAQVRLSSSGRMTIYNGSSTVNLVIDLQGYFTASGTTGATFTPGIGRVYDSRAAGNTILAKNESRAIQVAGKSGVPVMGSGITAVVLTLTAVHGGSDGRASVWANGAAQPETTSLNFQNDEIRTNTVTVALGANGKINLNNVANPTNYLVDVQGWYVDPTLPTISCPSPYAAGEWQHSIPTAPIVCTVEAPAATDSDSMLFTVLDDEPQDEALRTDAGAVRTTITVPAVAGWHELSAVSVDAAGSSQITDFAFGLNDSSPSRVLQAVQSASPTAFRDISQASTTSSGSVALATQGDVNVTVPTEVSGEITFQDGSNTTAGAGTVSTGLPFAQSSARAKVEANGIVSYDNGNGSTTVPLAHDDGSVQIATVIDSAAAPTEYAYPITLPPGASLQPAEGGGATITDADGVAIAGIQAPWAKDAAGMDVPTSFRIVGDTLTQVVDLSSPTLAFPVVADPSWWRTAWGAAKCAAEIAGTLFVASKLLKGATKIKAIVKASKVAIKAYNKLGGTAKKLLKNLNKYFANKTGLKPKTIKQIEVFLLAVGDAVMNALGYPSCWQLITRRS